MSKKLLANSIFVQFVTNLIMKVVSFGYSVMYVINGIITNVWDQARIFIKVRNQKIGFVMIVLFKPRPFFKVYRKVGQIQILCIFQIIAAFIPMSSCSENIFILSLIILPSEMDFYFHAIHLLFFTKKGAQLNIGFLRQLCATMMS